MLENYQSKRKDFLQNAMNLVKLTKGKGLIMGSETSHRVFMRSPIDAMCIAKLVGLNDQQARDTVQKNCQQAFQHAHYRKTHKGVAEIIEGPVSSSSEDSEMQE